MLYVMFVVLVSAVVLLLVANRTVEEFASPSFAQVTTGGDVHRGEARAIPKIIWSYWHDAKQPLVVERCVANWRRLNPDYTVHMLHAGNITEFIPADEIPQNFGKFGFTFQADWLRLALLSRHGGIWFDASIFLTAPVDWMLSEQVKSGSEYLGFYLERFTQRKEYPVVESWCMAAVQGSGFMRAWRDEFTLAIGPGNALAYLDDLKKQGIYEATLQKINAPTYLVIHMTGQRILQNGEAWKLSVLKAEDSAYFYQVKSKWRRLRLYWRLLIWRHPVTAVPVVKLRGGERRKLEKFLRWKIYRKNGLLGTHLMRDALPDLPK